MVRGIWDVECGVYETEYQPLRRNVGRGMWNVGIWDVEDVTWKVECIKRSVSHKGGAWAVECGTLEYGTWDMGRGRRDVEGGVYHTECQPQRRNVGRGMRNVGIWYVEYGTWNAKYEIRSMGCGT